MEKQLRLILISTGIFLCTIFEGRTQDFSDFALQFGQRDLYGSARMLGTGGNHNALGGDLSAAAYNPAGLGFYNKSEVILSPSVNSLKSSSDYLGNTSTEFKNPFNLASGGAVLNRSNDKTNGWRGGSWGFSFSRIGSFQNRLSYQGNNTSSDFIDHVVDDFNFGEGSELSQLAINTGIVGEFYDIYEEGATDISINGTNYDINQLYGTVSPGDTLFFVDRNIYDTNTGNLAFPNENFPTDQRELINRSGAQYQTSIAYGGNYSDKFYFGASLGLLALRYESERIFRELPTGADLTNFTLTDNRLFTGAGVNGTFGVIVRPINEFSVGVSYTTPTYYFLEDESVLSAQAEYTNQATQSDVTNFLPVRIDLRTPARLSGGIALFLGKHGFVTADVEYIDYSTMKFSSSEFSMDFANEDIREKYEATFNYNMGIEFRHNIFRLRGGYSHQGDPFIDPGSLDRSRDAFTVGAGLRFQNYFIDAAVVHSEYQSSIGPYPGAPTALIDNSSDNAVITLGMKF